MAQRRSRPLELTPAEIGRLYDRLAPRLVRFFMRRVLDAELAVELTAETFAELLAQRGKFRGSSQAELEGWLFKLARTQLTRYLRKGHAERRAIERYAIQMPILAPDEIERINASIDLATTREHIRAALEELPEAQREALRLRVVDQLPFKEVAEILGVSEETARTRVSRALRTLHKHLEDVINPKGALP
jgi:RNA polymerase sigma-70 factor (ECF subfamily)